MKGDIMGERVSIATKSSESNKENSVSRARKPSFSQSISSPIDQILFLQRTIGNQAVQRLFESGVIQAKLKISQPNDIYKQEADRVAEQVMRIEEPQITHGNSGGISVGGVTLQGRTTPNFSFSYALRDDRCEPAEGCTGCPSAQCVRCTGTIVITYRSSPRVRLPSVPRGLRPCQRRIVQDAIENILAPHEQEHVTAFRTYEGEERIPYDPSGCRASMSPAIRRMVNSRESARKAAVQATSDALDPFNPTIDITCED